MGNIRNYCTVDYRVTEEERRNKTNSDEYAEKPGCDLVDYTENVWST